MNTMSKNTLQKGSFRYIVFKEDDTWFAVALEFNIVEEGSDPKAVLFNLFEAAHGYVVSAVKAKLSSSVLNQQPDQEYEQLWQQLESKKTGQAVKSPYQVFTYGKQMI